VAAAPPWNVPTPRSPDSPPVPPSTAKDPSKVAKFGVISFIPGARWLDSSVWTSGRQMAMSARSCKSIITRNLDQAGEERVARFARSASKLGERMLAGWTRCELTATDSQAAKQQQPLVVFRKGTHQVRQELECVRMRFQTLGRARRCIAATKHGGVNEEIGQEWCAGRVRHGLQSAWPKQWG
jgi:hypothetical protein